MEVNIVEGILAHFKILGLVVTECLRKAHEHGLKSIAFPALGCGFLGHPPDIVAQTMKDCIETFEDTCKDTTLKQLFIVMFTKARDWKHVQQVFQHVFDNKERTVDKRVPKTGHLMAENFPTDFSKTCIRERKNNSCKKVLACGHVCGGFRDEPVCPPCLQTSCISREKGQAGNDDCVICYTDPLLAAPVITLKCGHMYHLHCVKRILESKWVGPRITFNFILCPMCKEPMEHTELNQLLEPVQKLYEDVKRKAMMRLQFEGLEKSDQFTNRASPYHNKPTQFAMDRYCYYPCFKCKNAYFGGTVQCEGGAEDKEIKLEDMVCPSCSSPQAAQVCSTHGTDFIEYKCRYCCTIAVFYCFGTTHFCNACHSNNTTVAALGDRLPKCPAGPVGKQLTGACPLGIQHPSTGTEFCIGCGLCANLRSF